MNQYVVFLDVDGVLNNFDSLKKNVLLIPSKLKLLAKILEETRAKIVVSSSWGHSLKPALEKHSNMGKYIASQIIGVTPKHYRWRGDQIKAWLSENKVKRYVVIEDEICDVCGPLCATIDTKCVVKVNPVTGLTLYNTRKAKLWLFYGIKAKVE